MTLFRGQLHRLLDWLSADNASHATVILLFVTGLYVLLTFKMARAMSRQTKAMLQPILSLGFSWSGEKFSPRGEINIENLGSQPVVLLDIFLTCSASNKPFEKAFGGLDDNVIAPHQVIHANFDFENQLTDVDVSLAGQSIGYELAVVASDLGREAVLEYKLSPVLAMRVAREKYPLRVRLKYLSRAFKWKYYRFHDIFSHQPWWAGRRHGEAFEEVIPLPEGAPDVSITSDRIEDMGLPEVLIVTNISNGNIHNIHFRPHSEGRITVIWRSDTSELQPAELMQIQPLTTINGGVKPLSFSDFANMLKAFGDQVECDRPLVSLGRVKFTCSDKRNLTYEVNAALIYSRLENRVSIRDIERRLISRSHF